MQPYLTPVSGKWSSSQWSKLFKICSQPETDNKELSEVRNFNRQRLSEVQFQLKTFFGALHLPRICLKGSETPFGRRTATAAATAAIITTTTTATSARVVTAAEGRNERNSLEEKSYQSVSCSSNLCRCLRILLLQKHPRFNIFKTLEGIRLSV